MAGRQGAVLGSPVAHSLSPVLHGAAYRALGLSWSYRALECDEGGLGALLAAVRADPSWVGLSLTMPLKASGASAADALTPLAAVLGVVNTLVVEPGGRLRGDNTDVDGLLAAVRETGWSPGGPPPVVLGAGGTARAALAALGRLGAPAAVVAARRPSVAASLVELGERVGVSVAVRGFDLPPEPPDLVVATAPAGATDALAAAGPWPAGTALVESLYTPWPTPLAAAALAAGAPVAGGLSVLVGQAVGQVRLFTGRDVDPAVLLAAGEAALAARAVAGSGRGA